MLHFFQGFILPGFQQFSSGIFRGSVKSRPGTFRTSGESVLEDPALTEVAKQLCKIRKNDLAALLDKTILPRIQARHFLSHAPLWPALRCNFL